MQYLGIRTGAVSVGERIADVRMRNQSLVFSGNGLIWKELSQPMSFIDQQMKLFTVSQIYFSFHLCVQFKYAFILNLNKEHLFFVVDAQTLDSAADWIVLKDMDCFGDDIKPQKPASSIFDCIQQCHGFTCL